MRLVTSINEKYYLNQHKNTDQHKELTDKDTNCILVLGVIGPFRLVRTAHIMLRYITSNISCTLQHTSEHT